MSGINAAIEQGYTGPACLYKILGHRQEKNPLFRRGNPLQTISPQVRKKKTDNVPTSIKFAVELKEKISNRMSLFLIIEKFDLKNQKSFFEIIDSRHIVEENSKSFTTDFRMKKLKSIDFRKAVSMHLLLMHSASNNTDASDLHRASCLCNRLNSFSFDGYLTEEVSLKLKAPMAIIEIKSLFSPFMNFSKSLVSSSSLVKTFRSFFSPLLTHSKDMVYSLSTRFSCRLFTPVVIEETASNIAFSISVSQTPMNARRRDEIVSEHLISSSDQLTKTGLNYHILVKLKNQGKYLEFCNLHQTNVKCIWCGMNFGKSVEFNRTITKLSSSSINSLWQLFQHSICCHYHLNSKFFLSEDGTVHVYISPATLVHPEKNIYKGPKYFQNMRAAKLNHQNIYTQLWAVDNPPALSKIYTEYFHSSTGLPISIQEMDYESDEEDVDMATNIHHRNVIIDEFCDITAQEKELMKLWNIHVATFPSHGDKFFPVLCQRFVVKFGHLIVEKKLRHNLLLHFLNLWDFGLLVAEELYQYMQYIDNIALNM